MDSTEAATKILTTLLERNFIVNLHDEAPVEKVCDAYKKIYAATRHPIDER